jgi:hypothetical protein
VQSLTQAISYIIGVQVIDFNCPCAVWQFWTPVLLPAAKHKGQKRHKKLGKTHLLSSAEKQEAIGGIHFWTRKPRHIYCQKTHLLTSQFFSSANLYFMRPIQNWDLKSAKKRQIRVWISFYLHLKLQLRKGELEKCSFRMNFSVIVSAYSPIVI